jgi:uncharacterized RDD family membrane protein YckC
MTTAGDGMEPQDMEYVGFWPRVGAALIDTLLLAALTLPALSMIYGADYWTSDRLIEGPAEFLISWVLPAVLTLWFWVRNGQTPGKMAIGARVVDARTGQGISLERAVARYIGYYVSMIVLFVGYLWVGFDPRKQGWHDHIAGTVVVRKRNRSPEPVVFNG